MFSVRGLEKFTFMSWEERGYRAIALCDSSGYFEEAINCCRDGDMGAFGSDGVWSRIWYGDHVYNGSECVGLRPADSREVSLYMSHCGLSSLCSPCTGYAGGGYSWDVVYVSRGFWCTDVYVRPRRRYSLRVLLSRIRSFFR